MTPDDADDEAEDTTGDGAERGDAERPAGTNGSADAGGDAPDDPESPFAELGTSASDGDRDPFAELDEAGDRTDAPPDAAVEMDRTGGEVDAGDEFAAMDTPELDDEEVWDALEDDGELAAAAPDGEAASEVETTDEEHVVPKASYCEKCEHFSRPPETACSNPGTEIRELVDVDHFRVANCPVVERRGSLGYDEN